MDNRKRDAVRVSRVIGVSLLFSMLPILAAIVFEPGDLPEREVFLLFTAVRSLSFAVSAVLGVGMLRRSDIRFPAPPQGASLNKALTVMLSSFGLLVIFQILYSSVFPSVTSGFGMSTEATATEIFTLFVFSTLVPAVAEEVFFRGFLMRSMRVYRESMTVLMSALAFSLMHLSVEAFPLYFVFGLFMGMAYLATHSLAAVIAIRFLCNAFWFLSEAVSIRMPELSMTFMQGGLIVCILLSASGLPYLRENMKAFFENDDARAIPSSCFWTAPTILFVGLAVGIQLLLRIG